ncbi:hypothetical protein Ciccas_009830 [Cichlidogyrus casuarinus]|uniref:Uncharacterized protein n=1 Tax=Cichlidogyrus casuarinus TaxID=1844966 RepID=A0ABD2PVW3_9PLAT
MTPASQPFVRRNSFMPMSNGNEPVYSTHPKMPAHQPMTLQNTNYLQYYYPSAPFGSRFNPGSNTIYGTIHKRPGASQFTQAVPKGCLPTTNSVDELASHLDTSSNVAESVIIPPPNDFSGSRSNSVGPMAKLTPDRVGDKAVTFAPPAPPERRAALN